MTMTANASGVFLTITGQQLGECCIPLGVSSNGELGEFPQIPSPALLGSSSASAIVFLPLSGLLPLALRWLVILA